MIDKTTTAYQDCLQHAFEEAASGIENWEYAGYESEEERKMTFAAAKQVAKSLEQQLGADTKLSTKNNSETNLRTN